MKTCSFCGKSQEQVKRIISGPEANICADCVLLCMEILVGSLEEYREIKIERR